MASRPGGWVAKWAAHNIGALRWNGPWTPSGPMPYPRSPAAGDAERANAQGPYAPAPAQ